MTYIVVVVLLLDLLWIIGTESSVSDNSATIQDFKVKCGYDITFILLIITACVCAANAMMGSIT